MRRVTLTFAILFSFYFSFSQTVRYSDVFDCERKNVPIAILNNNQHYFFVLRYNKDLHDFVVERRLKTSGKLITHTALGLDAINANWFDYENLDYIFHESKGVAYVIFEKVLNTKREIYFKAIDSLGRPGNFKMLAALDKGEGIEEIDFDIKLSENNKVLIVGKEKYVNEQVKKVAVWYDLESQSVIWAKKLPLENINTGYSNAYNVNSKGDLYFIFYRVREFGYIRKFINQSQVQVRVPYYDLISIACMSSSSKSVLQKKLPVYSVGKLNFVTITSDTSGVTLSAAYTASDTLDSDREKLFFLNLKWTSRLENLLYVKETPLDSNIRKQLNFFDGTDYSDVVYKTYSLTDKIIGQSEYYLLAARSDGSYYKEMILSKIESKSGEIICQSVIPRKIFLFEDRTRFKNLGVCTPVLFKKELHCFLLENHRNETVSPKSFRFHDFQKQGVSGGGRLVSYVMHENGEVTKNVIHQNTDYLYIPMPTYGNQEQFIFYLLDGRKEKFAFLNID